VQVVGANCAVCAAKIVMAREGRACASCDVPLHNGCAEGHVCDASAKPAAAAARTVAVDARPPAQRYRWVIIAASVTVASIVVPWFRHWRTERAIAERAAHRLRCDVSDIKVVSGPGSGITVSGCGTSVYYLRVCGQLDRPECLQEMELVPDTR